MAFFTGMRELIARLERRLARYDRAKDHRAAFLRVYAHMSRRVLLRMEQPFFLDPAWVERVAIRFATMYEDAVQAYDHRLLPPPAWQLALETASSRSAFVLQDVLLGVNAHINNDLPQVLATILAEEGDWGDPGRMLRRRFDHDQIDRILGEIVTAVEGEVSQQYGRAIRYLGWAMGRLDESLAAFGLKRFRDNTWRCGQFLLAAQTPSEQDEVRRWIEQDALAVGEVILRFGAPAWARPLSGIARRLRLC